MREVIVAANWKMHTTPSDAGELARMTGARTRTPGVVRVICPPYVCLAAVRDALAGPDVLADDGSGVAVGAQNVHHEAAGAYTGEVAATMLIGLASWVIVGHSERRRDAGETDEMIGRKLRAARAAGLRTILCVGEQLDERTAGRAEAVVEAQIGGALAGADPGRFGPVDSERADPRADRSAAGGPWLTIAYEPVWAIGTGLTARGSDAAAMARAIRATLAGLGFPDGGDQVPVLYGGSVTSASIGEFLAEEAIDGALVGGASLKPDEMAGIVARAGLTSAARAGLIAAARPAQAGPAAGRPG